MMEITRSFEIEVEMIDSDHRRLLDIINEITQAIDDKREAECARLVPDFVALAKRHFAREEALLAKNGYPGVEKHRKHHASLEDKMNTMLALAERVVESAAARDELKKELIFFLMDDVINEDMDFKSFLVNATSPAEKSSDG
ncbi:MAG: hemerythrin domain-containing protein [Proteobacteria bacterium]|nr:hemerythrin domain-containing protein [Pseudomonadota bacterium]